MLFYEKGSKILFFSYLNIRLINYLKATNLLLSKNNIRRLYKWVKDYFLHLA